ncbi:type II secretion system F family protein [Kitasatospora sp. NPDC048540]|uniref:type II secretion system F family protein n=1 Tax=unclassified Kitasatospora TaxID=2633591 RepID=UPI0007C712B6|nr:type II secretion system F family protein [Kitasatospora sp. MBT63]
MTPAPAVGTLPLIAGIGGVVVGFRIGLGGLRQRARARRRTRLLLGRVPAAGSGLSARAVRLWGRLSATRPRWLVPELLLLPTGLLLGVLARSSVPVLGALASIRPLHGYRRRRRTRVEAGRRSAAVIDLCAGLAAELRSGATAGQALEAVIARAGARLRRSLGAEPATRLAAAPYGADVPAALRLVAELPGGSGAAAVAACWQVATESGTGLAAGLEHVADALRAERALAEEIAGELAGPRATVAMLAALPLVGMLLGFALGVQPVRILLHTPAGLACLLGGVLLEAAGLYWTARIIRGAEAVQGAEPLRHGAGERRVVAAGSGAPSGCGLARTRAVLVKEPS